MYSVKCSYLLSEFLVFGLQVLAVSTPRSIELNENIFAVIIYKLVKVFSHNHLKKQKTTVRISKKSMQGQIKHPGPEPYEVRTGPPDMYYIPLFATPPEAPVAVGWV